MTSTDWYVPVEKMRGKLYTLDQTRERLAATEPLTQVKFSTSEGLSVAYGDGWSNREPTDPAPVWLTLKGGERYQLTFQAAQEIGSEARIPRQLQVWWPENLLADAVNWALGTGLGEKDLKLLCAGRGQDEAGRDVPLAVAMARGTVTPYSNLRLLAEVEGGIRRRYGTEAAENALVDYKLRHDLEATAFRVIVPGAYRVIEGSGTEYDDTWSAGVQVKNSPIGLRQTFLDGYLFRWICTNGQIDLAHSSGGFRRRGKDEEDVYTWAAGAVDEIFAGIEDHSFEAVQSLVPQNIEREVTTVLTDLFDQAHLPVNVQKRILGAMADTPNLTMYELLSAVTQAANAEDLPPQKVEQIMRMGGFIVHTAGTRCGNCRRVLPANWVAPEGFTPAGHPEDN